MFQDILSNSDYGLMTLALTKECSKAAGSSHPRENVCERKYCHSKIKKEHFALIFGKKIDTFMLHGAKKCQKYSCKKYYFYFLFQFYYREGAVLSSFRTRNFLPKSEMAKFRMRTFLVVQSSFLLLTVQMTTALPTIVIGINTAYNATNSSCQGW